MVMRGVSVAALAAALALSAMPALAAAGGSSGGGLPSSSGSNVDPAESFREGLAALETGDFEEADDKFGEVLSVAPKHPEANYFKAIAKIGLGKPEKSVRYLEKAIKARSDFVEARERLALVQIELGDLEAAQEQLAALEEIKADCAAESCDAPTVQRTDEAIARVTAALAAPPAEGEPSASEDEAAEETQSLFFAPREEGVGRYLAAVRLINEARYADAIKDLYKAQAIVGPHPDILNYLGYSHRKLGLMEQAQDYYAQALAIDPDHLGANEYLGELYLEIGDIEKAKRQLARLDALCVFGCAEREDLARLVALKEADRRAAR